MTPVSARRPTTRTTVQFLPNSAGPSGSALSVFASLPAVCQDQGKPADHVHPSVNLPVSRSCERQQTTGVQACGTTATGFRRHMEPSPI